MKKHRIVFATGNAGKMKEIRLIMADLGCEVVSMKEAGADPEIVENGRSFAENAEIKARAVWNCTGDIVLADDSGLVVDYIGGEPGIYSARYMGEDTSYEIKNRNIIDRLADSKRPGAQCPLRLQYCSSPSGRTCSAHRGSYGGTDCHGTGRMRRLWL